MTQANEQVEDLHIKRLERIFSPPGIPLVFKSRRSPTSTILVRGDAGSGKTTIACALAHSLALHLKGVALFFSAEALASELRFKAEFLGLPKEAVRGWSEHATSTPGTLLTQHVERTPRGKNATSPSERRLAALHEIIDMLGDPEDGASNSPNVRVVVLDGLLLTDVRDGPTDLRHDLVSFLQHLEALGITTILVEEVGSQGSDWIPFLVDLVFGLALEEDPDTGKLIRRLRCTKSRYAHCQPGPHDMGLEDERPALWPDPLAVEAASPDGEEPPDFFWPYPEENRYYVLSGPGVVAAYYDRAEVNILRPHLHSLGTKTLKVACGSVTSIRKDGVEVDSIHESDGPYALAWSVLEHSRGCNFVSIGRLPGLMRRRRFRLPLLHMMDALARAGKRVCVHGHEDDVAQTENFGAVVSTIERHPGRLVHTIPTSGILPASRWVEIPPSLMRIDPRSAQDLLQASRMFNAAILLTDVAIPAGNTDNIPQLLNISANTHSSQSVTIWANESTDIHLKANIGQATLVEYVRHALLHSRVGDIKAASKFIAVARSLGAQLTGETLRILLAWASALLGHYWEAARILSSAIRQEQPPHEYLLLWELLRLRFATSATGVCDVLELAARSELESVSAPFIVDALVREEGLDAAWNWLLDRRCSDDPRVSQYLVGLAGLAQESTTRRALESLETLSGPQDLLSIECAYNLGVYYARVGNIGAAKSKFSVTSSNPQLFELAKAYLLRL